MNVLSLPSFEPLLLEHASRSAVTVLTELCAEITQRTTTFDVPRDWLEAVAAVIIKFTVFWVMTPRGYDALWLWRHVVMTPCGYDAMWLWRHVVMTPRGYDALWLWRHVVMTPCGYDALWLWRHVVMTPCGYDTLWLWHHVVSCKFACCNKVCILCTTLRGIYHTPERYHNFSCHRHSLPLESAANSCVGPVALSTVRLALTVLSCLTKNFSGNWMKSQKRRFLRAPLISVDHSECNVRVLETENK